MNEPRDPNETLAADTNANEIPEPAGPARARQQIRPVDLSALAADSLEVGLAAAFGKNSGPPRSSLGHMRPVLLKEAEGESSLVVKPTSDAMPLKERGRRSVQVRRRDRPRRHGGRAARPRRRPGPRPGGQGAAREVRQPARRRPAVHRRGPDRRPASAPGRGAGLRHRPVRRPAVLHDEAGERPDARGDSRRTRPTHRPIVLACWASLFKCRRRWRMPTPRASFTATSSRRTSWSGRSARSR